MPVRGYDVVCGRTLNGESVNPLNPTPLTTPAFKYTNVIRGVTYYCKVLTVALSGKKSAGSLEVRGTIP
jgi:hypothetical protein